MSLVLHYAPWSSASTCLWALEELGVPYERVKHDLPAGDTKKPEFLALNPNAKVPVLVHDGQPIFESIAILAHLGETFGEAKKLFPRPGIERALAFQWLAWANVTVAGAVARLPANEADPAATRRARAEIQSLLEILGAALDGRSWLVGETFTLVDLHLAGMLHWIATLGFDPKAIPNVAGWLARCSDRPSFAAARAG